MSELGIIYALDRRRLRRYALRPHALAEVVEVKRAAHLQHADRLARSISVWQAIPRDDVAGAQRRGVAVHRTDGVRTRPLMDAERPAQNWRELGRRMQRARAMPEAALVGERVDPGGCPECVNELLYRRAHDDRAPVLRDDLDAVSGAVPSQHVHVGGIGVGLRDQRRARGRRTCASPEASRRALVPVRRRARPLAAGAAMP